MGMYTEFVCAIELKRETHINIINILKHMNGIEEYKIEDLVIPKHEFFKCDRWKCLFRGDSYYFVGTTNTIFQYDEIAKTHFLTVRSNIKNYDSEIEKFLDWIKPYINTYGHEFLGYSRYEECEEPTLIYYDEI